MENFVMKTYFQDNGANGKNPKKHLKLQKSLKVPELFAEFRSYLFDLWTCKKNETNKKKLCVQIKNTPFLVAEPKIIGPFFEPPIPLNCFHCL